MTPAHFVTWPNWTLLGLNLIAEAAVLWLAVSRRFSRRLIMLPVFAGFCLLLDIAAIVLDFTLNVDAANGSMWFSRSYWIFYWGGQIIAGRPGPLTGLADHYRDSAAVGQADYLAWIGSLHLHCRDLLQTPAHQQSGRRSNRCHIGRSVTVLSLPIIWVVKPSEWPKEIKLIASGLVVSLVLQTGCTAAAASLKTLVGTVTIGVPLSSLIGMGFFFTALWQTEIQEASSMKRISETHTLREDSSPLSPSKLA